jgi:hypothetical protein
MKQMKARYGIVGALVSLAACGGQALDLGSDHESGAAGTSGSAGGSGNANTGDGAGSLGGLDNGANSCPGNQVPWGASGGSGPVVVTPLPDWPNPAAACDEELGSLRGTWRGSALDSSTVNGSWPDFTVSLAADRAEPCGTLTFGDPVSYPPATQADEPYAPGGLNSLGRLTGFSYTMLDATFDDNRLRFRINWSQPWQSFCQLQTPVCDPEFGGFDCAGVETELCKRSHDASPHPRMPACVCDWQSCDASLSTTYGDCLIFDFHVTGDSAQGVVGDSTAFLEKD